MTTPDEPVRPALAKTKIVATVGPACQAEEQLLELIEAGVSVFRLNMAHSSPQERQQRLAAVRGAIERAGRPVAVLADLAGPKIRLGELPGGQLDCRRGQTLRFVRGLASDRPGELTATYEPLLDELAPGDKVMLADGTVSLVVERRDAAAAECRVVQPGLIRSRQGINLPGVKLSVPAISDVDAENAVWAARQGIDFIGLSFVRSPADVRQLQAIIAGQQAASQVIAKIEKPEALERLAEIVDAADGVMVARGDLGVEIDIAQVPLAQKRIVAQCRRRRKPVIIATQMLDSMQHSRLPTRAEVTDVANAILDGGDACMLSGETAIGQYPREAVEMMQRIARATEPGDGPCAASPEPDRNAPQFNAVTEATVSAAGRIAEEVGAKLVLVISSSGATALAMAKHRNFVPTVGVSHDPATLRRMCLYWGVFPLAGAPADADTRTLLEHVIARGRQKALLSPGDRLVAVAGTGLPISAHNMIVVQQVT